MQCVVNVQVRNLWQPGNAQLSRKSKIPTFPERTDERGDDDGDAALYHGGQLVEQALPTTRRHDDENIVIWLEYTVRSDNLHQR
jgi:hypothetical protein